MAKPSTLHGRERGERERVNPESFIFWKLGKLLRIYVYKLKRNSIAIKNVGGTILWQKYKQLHVRNVHKIYYLQLQGKPYRQFFLKLHQRVLAPLVTQYPACVIPIISFFGGCTSRTQIHWQIKRLKHSTYLSVIIHWIFNSKS